MRAASSSQLGLRGENTEAINLTRKLISTDNVLAVVGPQFSAELSGCVSRVSYRLNPGHA